MGEFLANFHFLRPWYLGLLVLPLVFGVRFFRSTKNKSSWENVIDRNLLDYLLVKGSSSLRAFVAYLVLIGFVFAIVAIAGPAWKKKDVSTLSPDNPVIILLSLSSDMVESDVTPDRLVRAKFKIGDLLKMIKGSQTGLAVYTNEPFLVTPITSDLGLVANLLNQIEFDIMPVDGDRLDRAIDLAVKRLKDAGYRNANLVIMAADGGERFDLSLKAAEASGFKISAVNISKNEMDKLKLIADKTGGVFANITADDGDIKRIADLINASVADELKLTENMQSKFEDFGYYLLFVPLLCCMYLFRRGILAIGFLVYATSAQAAFFLNDNQAGLKDFSAGNFSRAAVEFKDAKWKAAALYRAGKFEEAFEEYSKFDDAESVYNQGNALAKAGKIEEAIAKYEEVLAVEPRHEDARFNLDYLRQQQEQNQEPESSSSSEDESRESEQNNSGSEGHDDNKAEIATPPSASRNDNEGEEQEQGDMDSKPTGSLDFARDDSEGARDDNKGEDGDKRDGAEGSDQENNQEKPSDNGEDPEDGKDGLPADPNVRRDPLQPSLEREGDGSTHGNEDNEKDGESRQVSVAAGESDDEGEDYSEVLQAREQQFREIPEDVGGLLRAFILKEYRKGRYEKREDL